MGISTDEYDGVMLGLLILTASFSVVYDDKAFFLGVLLLIMLFIRFICGEVTS